ncbi:MAG: hypothetical protein CME64_04425 [Halobacteriovoraceae bacterium]|nr:hypothetical protein [Halobacteriovoraceae bacterium]|tara:strand:- start:164869 stop:165393 length:525 start_codon:yes stop_codon:yes gene_type:complete
MQGRRENDMKKVGGALYHLTKSYREIIMRSFFLIALAILGTSCSTGKTGKNQLQMKSQAKGFISPNQKIEATILVEETEKSWPSSSVVRGVLKAGSIVAQHTHPESDEYLVFSSGAGELTVGNKTYYLKDGDTVFIPKNTVHSYVNRSEKDAHFIQVYTPFGPEQRFKKWSEKK